MTVLTRLAVGGHDVVVRQATAHDVAAIVELLAADQIRSSRDGVDGDEGLEPYLRAFAEIDADPAHLLVVATSADEVIATLQLSVLPGLARRGARRAQIEAVRVRGDHRGRGLGQALIAWSIDEAGRRGCGLVQLTSHRSRVDAHRFYERLGFVASHEGFKLSM